MEHAQIRSLAKELRLLGISHSLDRRLNEANQEGLSASEVLLRILDDEKQYRRNLITKALETKAKFRRDSLLENWDSSIERGISKTKLRELASLNIWTTKKNLILVGPTGCGKTQLSIALGRAACQQGLSVSFMSVQQLLEEAQSEKACGRYSKWSQKIKKIDVLILDDFALRPYTHNEGVLLVELLEDRYQKKIQIISSQVDIDGWKTLFEDPVIADALVDRLKNPSERIQLLGGSYREKLGR
jgi:DNA replication protein DnaC